MKPESKLLIMFVLLVLTACSGCKEKYKITGLGERKLGDTCWGDYSSDTSFMFFSKRGIRGTPKSGKAYSVYYERTYSYDPLYGGGFDRQVKILVENFYNNLNEVIIALKNKYSDCCSRQYELQEKPVAKKFITKLINWAGNENLDNSWQMVFEASDKNRHIGIFISDDACALNCGKRREISCRIRYATEMKIVVAAWDDDLLYLTDKERKEVISDGL